MRARGHHSEKESESEKDSENEKENEKENERWGRRLEEMDARRSRWAIGDQTVRRTAWGVCACVRCVCV